MLPRKEYCKDEPAADFKIKHSHCYWATWIFQKYINPIGCVEKNIMFGCITVTQHAQANATSITGIPWSLYFYPGLKYLFQIYTKNMERMTGRRCDTSGSNAAYIRIPTEWIQMGMGNGIQGIKDDAAVWRQRTCEEHRKQNQKASGRVIKVCCHYLIQVFIFRNIFF